MSPQTSNPELDAVGAGGEELLLTRMINAPPSLVFKAWTSSAQLARWWGLHQFANPVCEIDARPGGAIRIDMQGPDGTIYPSTGTVHEVEEPERLVLTIIAHGDDGGLLIESLVSVTFADRNGQTELTVVARVVQAAVEAAPHLAGMEAGWTQSLERLSELAERA